MTSPIIRSKIKAVSVHFSISAAIFLVIAYFLLVHWYPYPYFVTDGGWEGVRLMLFVDVVLGPFLTFLVFDPGKTRRALIFDLSAIGVVQLIALTWGATVVHGKRPVAIIQIYETMQPLEERSFSKQGISLDLLHQFSDEYPPIIYMLPALSRDELMRQKERLERGIGENEQFDLYRKFKDNIPQAFEYQLDMQKEVSESEQLKQELDELLAKRNAKLEDFFYMPYLGNYKAAILVFDKEGNLAGALYSDFNMFRVSKKN